MAAIVCELKWIKQLLSDIGLLHPELLYCDSQSTLYIAKNLVFHERTKHIKTIVTRS